MCNRVIVLLINCFLFYFLVMYLGYYLPLGTGNDKEITRHYPNMKFTYLIHDHSSVWSGKTFSRFAQSEGSMCWQSEVRCQQEMIPHLVWVHGHWTGRVLSHLNDFTMQYFLCSLATRSSLAHRELLLIHARGTSVEPLLLLDHCVCVKYWAPCDHV